MKKRPISNFFSDRRGSITVEFVIVLPLMLSALVFIFELGRAFLAYEIVSHDIRAAIRYLSRAETVDFTNTSGGYVQSAKNLAQTGSASVTANCPASYPASGSTNCHFPWTSSSQIDVSTTSSGNFNVDGVVVYMKASVPMNLSFLGFIGAQTAYTLTVDDTAQYIGD